MVYNQKFVVVIKCNGKILREVNSDNDVILPFGSEYSILLKNLDNRRAVAEVSIDGVDVLDGRRLVIDANESTELKGVMINNAVKNAFKFIQKTKKIQEHRGDKIDDGFIRIKFGFERTLEYTHWTYPTVYKTTYHNSFYSNHDIQYGGLNENNSVCNASSSVVSDDLGSSEAPKVEEGITVAGSEIRQDFNSTHVGTIEDHGIIIIRLKGNDKIDEPVRTPIFVKTRKECKTCGTKSQYTAKYCPECGTNLDA